MEMQAYDDRLPQRCLAEAAAGLQDACAGADDEGAPALRSAVADLQEKLLGQADAAVKDAAIRALCLTVNALPTSPLVKDLSRAVRDVLVCHACACVGYTCRERVVDKVCGILGVERIDALEKTSLAQLWGAYEIMFGKLPGAFRSKFKESGRPIRAGKAKAKNAETQTSEPQEDATTASALSEPGSTSPSDATAMGPTLRRSVPLLARDQVVVQTVCALSDALVDLPPGSDDLVGTLVREMAKTCNECIFGVRLHPNDLVEAPAVIFDQEAIARVSRALCAAMSMRSWEQSWEQRVSVYALAAKALPLPQIMDLFAFDSWAFNEVLSTAYSSLDWCLSQFTGQEDWTTTSADYRKVWARGVLLKLTEQRTRVTGGPPRERADVMWTWLLRQGRNAGENPKYVMQMGSMLLVILFGDELEFLLYGAQNLRPWVDGLHVTALLSIDSMLNDLIYAELVHMDYSEIVDYILRARRFDGCWRPTPSRASIYCLGTSLQGHLRNGDELLVTPHQQHEEALHYMLATAYSVEEWEETFQPSSACMIDAVLWAITKLDLNAQSLAGQIPAIRRLASKVSDNFAWWRERGSQAHPFVVDACEKATALLRRLG